MSPDGKTIVNTSETTNMAHFFDFASRKMVASVLVGARPRIAEFKHDGSEVWVSSELGGTVSVIDPMKHAVTHTIEFQVQGLRAEGIQPVGIRFTKDDSHRLRRTRAGEPCGGDRHQNLQGQKISPGRPARLADGVHAG